MVSRFVHELLMVAATVVAAAAPFESGSNADYIKRRLDLGRRLAMAAAAAVAPVASKLPQLQL